MTCSSCGYLVEYALLAFFKPLLRRFRQLVSVDKKILVKLRGNCVRVACRLKEMPVPVSRYPRHQDNIHVIGHKQYLFL